MLKYVALTAFLSLATAARRQEGFIGYSEAKTPCRDDIAGCPDWAKSGECRKNPDFMLKSCRASCGVCKPALADVSSFQGKHLALKTESHGIIRIKPLVQSAPKTVALIMDLASQKPSMKAACKFYRNEAVPADGVGPPYGLLQGSFSGLLAAPPQEMTPLSERPTRGAVATIAGADFYISLMDHADWGSAHTVWGRVYAADMAVVDAMVAKVPYTNFTHPQHGTVMRMMKKEVLFMPEMFDAGDQDETAEL